MYYIYETKTTILNYTVSSTYFSENFLFIFFFYKDVGERLALLKIKNDLLLYVFYSVYSHSKILYFL